MAGLVSLGLFQATAEALPIISISDASVVEGDNGAAFLDFNVSLSEASTDTVQVTGSTVNGTALAGSDYGAVNGSVGVFNPGVTALDFRVLLSVDVRHEDDETFFVVLSNPVNATLGDSMAQGTIVTDDPIPAISIDDVALAEGDAGTRLFVFTVSLSETPKENVQVTGSTANGTALAGSDYAAVVNSVGTFTPGVTSLTFGVFVLGDGDPELDESFFVNLVNPVNATLADSSGIGTILNDDGPLVAVAEPASMAVLGSGLLAFVLMRRRVGE